LTGFIATVGIFDATQLNYQEMEKFINTIAQFAL